MYSLSSRNHFAAVVVCLLLGALPAGAQSDDWAAQPLEPVFHALPGNIELLRLENGIEVVLMRNPAQPMAGIYTQVKVGSARELRVRYISSTGAAVGRSRLLNWST